MQRWEYKRVFLTKDRADDNDALLNELGSQGWELVALRPATSTMVEVWYLKRSLPAQGLTAHA